MKAKKTAKAICGGLRLYEAFDGEISVWIVSGLSETKGKRLRRRFSSKDKAEEFCQLEKIRMGIKEGSFDGALNCDESCTGPVAHSDVAKNRNTKVDVERTGTGGVPARHETKNSWNPNKRKVSDGWQIVLAFASVLFALGVDRLFRAERSQKEAMDHWATDFEVNPCMAGWTVIGGGEWVDIDRVSGRRSIQVHGGRWVSRTVAIEPLSWYRVRFLSRSADGPVSDSETASGLCRVTFVRNGSGEALSKSECEVPNAAQWVKSDFRFRAQPLVCGDGEFKASAVRIEFEANEGRQFLVDDVSLEKIAASEVVEWSDKIYATLPAKIQYQGKDTRWLRLRRTIEKLNSHQTVRVILVGGEAVKDLADGPIDLLLERLYPGSRVELISVSSNPTQFGMLGGSDVKRGVGLNADLFIVTAGQNDEPREGLEALVEEVRANNAAGRTDTEILLVTRWSHSGMKLGEVLQLNSGMRELDQDAGKNGGGVDDYRTRLMRFAAANGIEFLDAAGIMSEFIFGPAAVAKLGLPTNSDGVPYNYLGRDWLHSEAGRRQIIARIFEAYFAPSKGRESNARLALQAAKKATVKLFDPEQNPHDQVAYLAAMSAFDVGVVERPSLAMSFSSGSLSDTRRASGTLANFMVGREGMREFGYTFDEPLDVRAADVLVYWSFRSDRAAGEEKGALSMKLCFSDPLTTGRVDRSCVSLKVRPGGSSILSASGGVLGGGDLEHVVEVPVENFVDAARAAKFRLLLRWGGAIESSRKLPLGMIGRGDGNHSSHLNVRELRRWLWN